jgi:hypothetical protein
LGAADPGKALAQIAAFDELVYGKPDDRPPKPVIFRVPFRVNALELIEVLRNKTMKRRGQRIARPI